MSSDRTRLSDSRRGDRHLARSYLRPFVGVDGEGSSARNAYLLLRAGTDHLLEADSDLGSARCLDFLSRLPPDPIYVGYFFTYDVTMIVRDLPNPRLQSLVKRADREIYTDDEPTGRMRPVDVHDGKYQIDYLPNKEFSVRRRLGFNVSTGVLMYGPWIRVSDVGSFFQCSFVAALRSWFCENPQPHDMGECKAPEYHEIIEKIAEGKDKRSTFGEITGYEREYNLLEIHMLERLMTKFRRMCLSADIRPTKWQGPGNIATAVFRRERIPRRAKTLATARADDVTLHLTNKHLVSMANDSYIGGRFEPPQIGIIPGPIYFADINSAYPYVYRFLPCLLHGKWIATHSQPDDGLYIGFVRFSHNERDSNCLGVLPFRTKIGSIIYPLNGQGIYTSPELQLARAHGVRIEWKFGYRYEKQCDCEPFAFVPELYRERKAIGKSGKGITLKLALNSMYGKLAQSIGRPVYSNPIWATLITANTRAMITDLALQQTQGEDVVMLATDGLFTRQPRVADYGKELGQWDLKCYDEIMVIQSGLYVVPGTAPKTRGVPRRSITAQEQEFREKWLAWDGIGEPPSVSVCLNNFISLRLALHRNKPHLAGHWVGECHCDRIDAPHDTRQVSFEWRTKRKALELRDHVLYTRAYTGDINNTSVAYGKNIGGMAERYKERDYIDQDQPDWAGVLQ